MNTILKRLTATAAAVGTIGAVAPIAAASAATTPVTPPALAAFSLPALPVFNPAPLTFVGPSVGGLAAVIGPTVITVGAGNIFTNTTITTSAGGAVVAAP
ncbi:MAG: hypothetical protein QOH72_5731 [Solirubrobacteraceae bacterium]|jgi:hypothetical protein|nr:hypothetical protein [Solirubrobacteraceae bacterium]